MHIPCAACSLVSPHLMHAVMRRGCPIKSTGGRVRFLLMTAGLLLPVVLLRALPAVTGQGSPPSSWTAITHVITTDTSLPSGGVVVIQKTATVATTLRLAR